MTGVQTCALPISVRAARVAAEAGADGITAHLREDRRHISDGDIERLSEEIDLPLNREMAATPEMLAIALRHRPHAVCLVPEKRRELTTEGGPDAAAGGRKREGRESGGGWMGGGWGTGEREETDVTRQADPVRVGRAGCWDRLASL